MFLDYYEPSGLIDRYKLRCSLNFLGLQADKSFSRSIVRSKLKYPGKTIQKTHFYSNKIKNLSLILNATNQNVSKGDMLKKT